ncbi:toll/interleukin-1 receptor domain-containing protein [Bacillus cereus]|uniref:toll/interleukin-1 receptor domain-containing protein n=1 Tax=Bacillus cereus group TaxID=86661 RepID=UPI003012E7BA
MSNNTLFISHATKDHGLVEKFIEFFRMGLEIKKEEIYCTSGKTTRKIRTGVNFVQDMRDNITEAKLIVFILTPNFFNSKFCLAELGAAWALGGEIYPIAIPQTSFEELESTPLKGIQATMLKSVDDIAALAEDFEERGIVKKLSHTEVSLRARNLMKDIKKCRFEKEDIISEEEFSELEKNLQDLLEINKQQKLEIEKLKSEKEELVTLLDSVNKSAAASYKKKHSSSWDYFNELIDDTKRTILKLDDLAISAIYHSEFHKTDYKFWPVVNDDWLLSKARDLQARKFIDLDDQDITPNYNTPLIKEVLDKLVTLNSYINNEADEDVYTIFLQVYDFELDFSNLDFWEKVLDVKVYI